MLKARKATPPQAREDQEKIQSRPQQAQELHDKRCPEGGGINYFSGIECFMLSQDALKSKDFPWAFWWQVRHWFFMASGEP